MKILVCNVGSTSFKFQFIDIDSESVLARGGVERIGAPPSPHVYASERRTSSGKLHALDHLDAIAHAIDFLTDDTRGDPILENLNALDGVGFKTVFAKGYVSSALIDDNVIAGLEAYVPVMPVHNPAYIASIHAFERLAPAVPLAAVFETWFHETLPPYARELGAPRSWAREHAIRRYGFHGASHRYISERVPTLMDELGFAGPPADQLRVVSCHLGGSSSLCAIEGGRSMDTSMAFSAQSGVLQGTRCGDLDPFVPLYMIEVVGMSVEEVARDLMRDAGLAGISGVGGDMRDIIEAAELGNADAQLALDAYHYGVKKTIGGYAAAMGGVDALAFAGGIGERGAENRAAICEGLEFLGVRLNPDKNANHEGEGNIAADDSPAPVFVIPANEGIIVARETARLIREDETEVEP